MAAALVPVSKSSLTRTDPTGRCRWVWASTPPGTTRLPATSSIDSPSIGSRPGATAAIRPSRPTRTSAGRSPSTSRTVPPRSSTDLPSGAHGGGAALAPGHPLILPAGGLAGASSRTRHRSRCSQRSAKTRMARSWRCWCLRTSTMPWPSWRATRRRRSSPAAPTCSWNARTGTGGPSGCCRCAGSRSCGGGRSRAARSCSAPAPPTPSCSTRRSPPSCRRWPRPPAPSGRPQIRATGTIGGNLGTASPAGDALPCSSPSTRPSRWRRCRASASLPVADLLVGPKRTALGAGRAHRRRCGARRRRAPGVPQGRRAQRHGHRRRQLRARGRPRRSPGRLRARLGRPGADPRADAEAWVAGASTGPRPPPSRPTVAAGFGRAHRRGRPARSTTTAPPPPTAATPSASWPAAPSSARRSP